MHQNNSEHLNASDIMSITCANSVTVTW